jgi:alpha-ribazole phosphatase
VELYLIRHTRLQAEGLCYGRHDPPLAASFEAEAAVLATQIAGWPPMPVYSSPAPRCSRLAKYLDFRPQYDDRLLELDFGDWEGRAWAEIPRAQSDAWAANFVHQAPPNGECYAALQARVVDFLQDLRNNGIAHAVVISHAGVIRACLAHLKRIPLEQSFTQITIGHSEIIQVELIP